MTPTRALSVRALSSAAALALSFGGAVGAFVLSAGPASADTITVTNTADDGNLDSLRGVLLDANDGDVIVLTAGATYQLTRCEEVIKSLGVGEVTIGGAVTIQGNGATIEQTCPDRVLFTQDALTMNDVTITGGDAEGQGGGLLMDSKAPIVLNGVTFTGNSALSGGGGIETFGDITATGSTFTDNHAFDDSADGGGVQVTSTTATATFNSTTFSGNTAEGWGGAFEQESEEVAPEPLAADDGFTLTVTDSTVTGNTASGNGGGGLDTEDDATITIDHSTLSANTGGWGGAVGAFGQVTSFSSDASTYSGNTSGEDGGAVHLSGGELPVPSAAADTSSTNAQFVNSTITQNTEASFGALGVEGDLSLNQVTLTSNTSLGQDVESTTTGGRGNVGVFAVEGDAANVAAFTFTSRNSVVAQPVGAVNCTSFDTPATDGGYNFSDDDSCGFTDATSNVKTPNDPMLGALANNGGPTQTLLPRTGSPLLDAIPPASCGAAVDQRGITRPQGTGCDIGAVEVEVVTPTATPAAAAVVTPKFTG